MIEIIAVLFSLVSVLLTIKKNIWCWPTGIIGIIAFFYIFYQGRDWCNMSLQIIFILQSIYGWKWWGQNKDIPIDRMSKNRFKSTIELTGMIFVMSYCLTKIFNGNTTLLDSMTTSLSIIGMLLTAYKILESWWWWIMADILYIILFMENKPNPLYLSAFTYLIFLLLAIYGYLTWKKELNEQKI